MKKLIYLLLVGFLFLTITSCTDNIKLEDVLVYLKTDIDPYYFL